MAAHSSTSHASNPTISFTCFNKLPVEVRLMIWKFALPDPRIVYIKARRLRTDDDPSWWKRVRSDKAIEGPAGPAPYPEADDADDESSYDFFDIEDYELDKIERKMACKRLLTPDDKFTGRMTRADAKAILMRPEKHRAIELPGIHRPAHLHGVYSESGIPSLLLVCKESFGVASKSYTAAFGAKGAFPQTYFDFHRDTLHIDFNSLRSLHKSAYWYRISGVDYDPSGEIPALTPTDETSMVESLSVSLSLPAVELALGSSDRFSTFLYSLHRLFPRLKRLTIVERHYAPAELCDDDVDKRAEDMKELKFVESTIHLLQNHLQFNGHPIFLGDYRHIQSGRRQLSVLDPPEWVEDARRISEQHSNTSWPFFQVDYKSIIAEAYENKLLKQAAEPNKRFDRYGWPIYRSEDDFDDDSEDDFNRDPWLDEYIDGLGDEFDHHAIREILYTLKDKDNYLPEDDDVLKVNDVLKDNDVLEDDYDLEGVTDEDMLRLANEAEASMT